jgi:selenide,water dikinase
MEAGVFSSLQRNNELALADYELTGCSPADPQIRLLVDPQTSGGLLAALPAGSAEACVTELQDSGYPVAAIIAQAVDGDWQIVSG